MIRQIDAVLLVVVERHDVSALLGIEQFGTTAFAAARPGGGKPGLGALADQGTLEFRQCRKQMKGELAVDVPVSIPSLSDRSSTSRSCKVRVSAIRSDIERPSRSSRHTMPRSRRSANGARRGRNHSHI
jgi:hypothetical protein